MIADDFVLPHNADFERAILGSILIADVVNNNNVIMEEIVGILHDYHFYINSHQIIYRAIVNLHKSNELVNIITIQHYLENEKQLENIGGIAFIAGLVDGAIKLSDIHYYVKKLDEFWKTREIIFTGNDMVKNALSGKYTFDELLTQTENDIYSLSNKNVKKGFSNSFDILTKQLDFTVEVANNPGLIKGISTGFYKIDKLTGGLQNGDLIFIAGRPSTGKTSFGVEIIKNAALNSNIKAAFFSLEMTEEAIINRLLSSEARVNSNRIRDGKLTHEEWFRLIKAYETLSKAKIFIDDTSDISIAEISTKCKKLKRKKGLDLVLIDYAQLIRPPKGKTSVEQEISSISKGLKTLAKELNVPVLALSQLSRASEIRTDHRPQLSDLRGSGSTEQDADIVMFVYREETYSRTDENKGIAEIIIAKQRNGAVGTVELAFIKEFTSFGNLLKY